MIQSLGRAVSPTERSILGLYLKQHCVVSEHTQHKYQTSVVEFSTPPPIWISLLLSELQPDFVQHKAQAQSLCSCHPHTSTLCQQYICVRSPSCFFSSPPLTKPYLLSSDTGSVNKFTHCASPGMLMKLVACFTFMADGEGRAVFLPT